MIVIHCQCGMKLKCDDSQAGKRGRCPNCGHVHQIGWFPEWSTPEQPPHSDVIRFPCPDCGSTFVFDKRTDLRMTGVCLSCGELLTMPLGSFDTSYMDGHSGEPRFVYGRSSGALPAQKWEHIEANNFRKRKYPRKKLAEEQVQANRLEGEKLHDIVKAEMARVLTQSEMNLVKSGLVMHRGQIDKIAVHAPVFVCDKLRKPFNILMHGESDTFRKANCKIVMLRTN